MLDWFKVQKMVTSIMLFLTLKWYRSLEFTVQNHSENTWFVLCRLGINRHGVDPAGTNMAHGEGWELTWCGCVLLHMASWSNKNYCKISIVRHTKISNLNVLRHVLKLSLPNPMKPGVKSRMIMELEQHRQAMLQLHLSDRQVYCLLRWGLY